MGRGHGWLLVFFRRVGLTIVGAEVDRLWGCGDIEAAFAGHERVVAPWPRLPSTKHGPKTPSAVHLFAQPPTLSCVDPRQLWSTQPWVLRHHVGYYLSGEWERTGRTSADQHKLNNRYPLVVGDAVGRLAILAGHHRSAAALIEGRDVLVRCLPPKALVVGAVAVLPDLWVGGAVPGAVVDVGVAATRIGEGRRVVVASADLAGVVMEVLGLDQAEILDRLRVAGLT